MIFWDLLFKTKPMSEPQILKFRSFVDQQETLNLNQRDVCVYIYSKTASIVNQVVRQFKDTDSLSVAGVSVMIYKLMSFAHRFQQFTGEDKKEVVTYTILGGYYTHDVEITQADQMMIEQLIDTIWWASHDVVFAIKKKCSWCCGSGKSKVPKDPLDVCDVVSDVALAMASATDVAEDII